MTPLPSLIWSERPNKSAAFTLLLLAVLGIVAEVVPFVLYPVPSEQVASAQLPPGYPTEYTAIDYARARALDLSVFWSDLASDITVALALCALLLSGVTERAGAVSEPMSRAWLTRIVFLAALFLAIRFLGLPFMYCRFRHVRALGLSELTDPAWLKLVMIGMAVPLTLFVLKNMMVICVLPLARRFWWAAAAVCFFVVGLAPEWVSRTYPLDPVERIQALPPGRHLDALNAVLEKAGLNLPLRVVDESRRSKKANIYLAGRTGREYVLLTDTFLEKYTPGETALALAHELGHFQSRARANLIKYSMQLLSLMLGFGLAFWLTGRQALPISSAPRVVALSALCLLLVSRLLSPLSLALSRWDERLADHYALSLGANREEFKGLLLKVAMQELTSLDLPRWRYYLSAGHPTILERMALTEAR